MQEDKKKKVYIAIIVVCMLSTGGIFMYMNSGTTGPTNEHFTEIPASAVPESTTTSSASAAAARNRTGAIDPSQAEYPIPAVFPADTKINPQILNSSKVQSLTNYDHITVTGEETGKDDPFSGY